MEDAQEEFTHFSMDLEFLMRRKPAWREINRGCCSARAAS